MATDGTAEGCQPPAAGGPESDAPEGCQPPAAEAPDAGTAEGTLTLASTISDGGPDLSQAQALKVELVQNPSSAGAQIVSGDALQGPSDVRPSADSLVDLSVQGTKLLHKLVHTASAIAATRCGSSTPSAPEGATAQTSGEGIAERYSRLCDQYLVQSTELKTVVGQCAQKGEALERSAGTAPEAATRPEDPEEAALQERAAALRQKAREKNLVVKQLMDQMTKLLDDMTMWECCARDAAKPPAA